MQVSENCLDIIKYYEKLELKAYKCPAGKLTIGYGHVLLNGENFTEITKEKADQLLANDVDLVKNNVLKAVNVQINQNQLDALVSFVFNIGIGQFRQSTLLKLLNKGVPKLAAEQFDRWNKCNGDVLDGLTLRRITERELFEKENFELGCVNFYTFN